MVVGYNMRNQELNQIIGSSQLPRLDYNIQRRVENLKTWVDNLDSEKFFTDYELEGNSNFATFLIILMKIKIDY